MHRAIIAVGQTIPAQATIMGYADTFAMIGVVLQVAVVAVTMLRKGAAAGGRRIKSGMKQLQGGRHEPEGRH